MLHCGRPGLRIRPPTVMLPHRHCGVQPATPARAGPAEATSDAMRAGHHRTPPDHAQPPRRHGGWGALRGPYVVTCGPRRGGTTRAIRRRPAWTVLDISGHSERRRAEVDVPGPPTYVHEDIISSTWSEPKNIGRTAQTVRSSPESLRSLSRSGIGHLKHPRSSLRSARCVEHRPKAVPHRPA